MDCGGPACAACEAGASCLSGADCLSRVCEDSKCLDPSCFDGVENGDESDVDCGGGTCDRCPIGKKCHSTGDCETNTCLDNVCEEPGSCATGVLGAQLLLLGVALLPLREKGREGT